MLLEIAARLFAAALDRDIEREFVVKAIRSRQLAAPDPTSERWPWAVRIRALGSFAVEGEGRGHRLPSARRRRSRSSC